jgi:L-asparaginase II
MQFHVDVIVWRGGIAESRHRVRVALATAGAAAKPAIERDDDLVTTLRSAAKPFQLLPLVERGHADHWGWSDAQLALMAASHTGSPAHLESVRGILQRIGVSEQRLACGTHEPIDPVSRAYYLAHPEDRSAVYHNCSGKHAGMLCLALSEGWPLEGYEQAEHPVQRLMHRTVADVCGMAPENVAIAIDGCSVCVFGLPLSAMALGYARLASATAAGDARERSLARIRDAMSTNPEMVGGAGRLSTELMRAARGRILAKGGAEGLECIGIPERGLGIAVKAEDGDSRPLGPAVIALLERLGVYGSEELAALESFHHPVLVNAAGRRVGRLEAVVHEAVALPE